MFCPAVLVRSSLPPQEWVLLVHGAFVGQVGALVFCCPLLYSSPTDPGPGENNFTLVGLLTAYSCRKVFSGLSEISLPSCACCLILLMVALHFSVVSVGQRSLWSFEYPNPSQTTYYKHTVYSFFLILPSVVVEVFLPLDRNVITLTIFESKSNRQSISR